MATRLKLRRISRFWAYLRHVYPILRQQPCSDGGILLGYTIWKICWKKFQRPSSNGLEMAYMLKNGVKFTKIHLT
jgi:hypothetical protein